MSYIIYDKPGKILRQVQCPPTQSLIQAKDGEFIMEGTANDVTQKIANSGIAGLKSIWKGLAYYENLKIVDKTTEEIEAEKPTPPPEIPYEKQIAHITNEQLQEVLDRLENLETEA